jgi:hypothetical protein
MTFSHSHNLDHQAAICDMGGSLVCIVNLTTGIVPGGFLGFMAGAIIAYGLVYLVLTVIDG